GSWHCAHDRTSPGGACVANDVAGWQLAQAAIARWPGPGASVTGAWQLLHRPAKRASWSEGFASRAASSAWQTGQLASVITGAKLAAWSWQSRQSAAKCG